MHVGIFGTGLTDSSERILKKILDENHISSSKIGTKSKNKKSDCVFVLGGDKGVEIISIELLMHQFLYLELMNLNPMDSFHNLI